MTTSVSDLIQPRYGLKVEVPLEPRVGASARLGVGSYPTAHLDSVTLLVTGVQAVWYAAGHFARGLQVAADVEYGHSWLAGDGIVGQGDRWRAALLLGAKWTGRRGVVAEAQFGAGGNWSQVASQGGTLRTVESFTLEPRGDLRVGICF
ncbi:MAG: hypothetical protein HY902_18430 [Deltaproteobacteria bacterium]|nr:hypothetical protein [Deltaproteobacteria bacterium]